jgi:hypothetical protein
MNDNTLLQRKMMAKIHNQIFKITPSRTIIKVVQTIRIQVPLNERACLIQRGDNNKSSSIELNYLKVLSKITGQAMAVL